MSFQAMAWAVKQPLPCSEKMVLLMLANYANDVNLCWPSVARLAADSGLSASKVRKCVVWLEAANMVQRTMQIRVYGQTSNVYTLDLSVTFVGGSRPPLQWSAPPLQ
jgi:hypothetical protein